MRFSIRSAAALALLAVTGHSPSIAQGAEAGSLVIYNAQHDSLTKEWVAGFTRETGIKVTVRNGGDTELANQIVAEGKASPADVFLTENSPAMVLVDNAGLFAPVDPTTVALIQPPYRPSSGKWIGIAARSTVFVYNKNKFPPAALPKTLLELAEPAWKGRWAASPAGADFQAIVSALLESKGEEATRTWLKAMKTNFTAYRGNGTVMRAVNSGEIDGGVIYHYYYAGDQAKTGENSNNVALHYFKQKDPGAFVSVSGGGVLASSKNPKEAQAFLKWIAGKGGQDILRTGTSYEYAVGEGAASNERLVPLKDLDAPAIDASKLNSAKVTELMTQAGLL
jgi:iron(III) transport system substrate-binding protein